MGGFCFIFFFFLRFTVLGWVTRWFFLLFCIFDIAPIEKSYPVASGYTNIRFLYLFYFAFVFCFFTCFSDLILIKVKINSKNERRRDAFDFYFNIFFCFLYNNFYIVVLDVPDAFYNLKKKIISFTSSIKKKFKKSLLCVHGR